MDELVRKIKAFEYAGVQPEALKPYALGALLALFIFYLLRFGRKKVVVTAGPIWAKVASRRRIPFATIISFLFQALIFGAMFATLTDPRDKASPTIRQVVAVVVDVSGSMATLEGEKTRLALAKEEAQKIVEKISQQDVGMVVVSGESTKILSPLQNDGDSLASSLDAARVDFGPSDLANAVNLATQSMQAITEGDVRRHLFIITDDPKTAAALPPTAGVTRQVINVGANQKNAAVLDVIARPAPVLEGGYDLLVKVKSYAKEPLKGVLRLATDKNSVGQIPIQLPALGEFVKEYQLAESAGLAEGVPLRAVLSIEGDGLALDNEAVTVLPATKRAKVILVTSGNRFLELALKLNPEVSLEVVAPSAYTGAGGSTNTLVIFDRVTPENLAPKSILIEPSGNNSPFRIKKRIVNPRLTEWNADSVILRNALAKDIHIEEASVFVPDRADVRLMGLPEGPVALLRESEDRFLLAFGFDFTRSDLVLRIAFPVMLRNAFLRAMGWESSTLRRSLDMRYRVGEPFPLEVGAQLLDMEGNPVPIQKLGGVSVAVPTQAGVYQTTIGGKTKNIAFNVGEYVESDISKAEPTEHTAAVNDLRKTLDHESQEPRRPYWVYLLLAAMAIALIDWMLYHGRVIY